MVSAKNGPSSKVADNISNEGKKITKKCHEAIKRLDTNQLAEMEEFVHKQNENLKRLGKFAIQIITKLKQSANKPKDRLDAELLRDGINFMYIKV